MNLPLKVWLGFSMTMILPIVQCPRLLETTALSVYYRCKDTTPGCCSSDWLMQLQQSWCPLLRLLILGLVTLPIYNVVLILVGWRFQSNTRSSAKDLRLYTRPVKYPAPQPPLVPPKPPPRVRRRPAVPSPKRPSTFESVPYPSQMNPFADQEPYQILRRNLQLVLRGLQNPSSEFVPPRVPEPVTKPSGRPFGMPSGKPFGMPSGKPAVIPREIPSEITSDVVSFCPSEYPRTEVQKKRSKAIFKRLWQRWRSRNKLKKSKKSLVSVSSSSCSSTNASSCFYI